jgi:transcription elongation factor GreA-like protein
MSRTFTEKTSKEELVWHICKRNVAGSKEKMEELLQRYLYDNFPEKVYSGDLSKVEFDLENLACSPEIVEGFCARNGSANRELYRNG